MAQFKSARLTDDSFGNTIDNELGNAEKDAAAILGVPVDTDIPAMFVAGALGLLAVLLKAGAVDPTVLGEMRINGTTLKIHDGTAVRSFVFAHQIAFPSNAAGVHTISTSAASGVPEDGDIWDQI